MNHQKRRQSLAQKIQAKQIDCVAITSSPNLRYFLGYVGKSFERFCCGLLGGNGTKSALVVPMLDFEKAKKSSADQVFAWTDTEGYEPALRRAVKFLDSDSSTPAASALSRQ